MENLNSTRGPERRKEYGLVTPFHAATLQAFAKEMPEKAAELDAVLSEIDRQAVENFGVYESETKPGVSFSYSKLSISPEIIRHFASSFGGQQEADVALPEEVEKDNEEAKRQDYFLFSAFAPPPDGNAFTAQDVAIDRFIRLLPQVANSIRNGKAPPEITIYMLGAPTGFGGTVTSEWTQSIKAQGLEPQGELYAEFVQKHARNDKSARIVLQGISRGAVVAQKTSAALTDEMRTKARLLLDNPAGEHTDKSGGNDGLQIAAGIAAETIARLVFDDMMKTLNKEGPKFMDALIEKTGIQKDGSVQTALKRGAVLAEASALLKGSSLDTESTRAYIRRAMYDPLTFSRERLAEIYAKQQEGNRLPFLKNGKSIEVPFKGTHFFIYDRYKRWAQILDFVKNTK